MFTEFCFPIVVAFPGFNAQFSVYLNHDDKDIRTLALELPSILMQDLALSTRKKYFRMFQKWETWAKQKKVLVIPAQPIFFNLFLFFQMKKESSFSTLSGITSARACAHKKLGLYSPTESAMTKYLIRAGQRILGCATVKGKHRLKVEHLKALQDFTRQICFC